MDKLGQHGADMVAELLVFDPLKRLSARKVVDHVCFAGAGRQLLRSETPEPANSLMMAPVETPEKLEVAPVPQVQEDVGDKVEVPYVPLSKFTKTAHGCHGFDINAKVEAHSLQTHELNGARGFVFDVKGDRVCVSFPLPIGDRALKPANLKLVIASQWSASACSA